MFIVKVTYKTSLDEVDKYLHAHREYLDVYYKKGLLLASGPLKPRSGGIIIALTTDKNYLESVLQQDPFCLAEIADYELMEFTPIKHREEIRSLLQDTEGKLC